MCKQCNELIVLISGMKFTYEVMQNEVGEQAGASSEKAVYAILEPPISSGDALENFKQN